MEKCLPKKFLAGRPDIFSLASGLRLGDQFRTGYNIETMGKQTDRETERNQRRLVYRLGRPGWPEVTDLGRLDYRRAERPLGLHDHPGALELVYMARGRQTYVVEGTPFHTRGGEVLATFPDERHSTGGTPEEKSLIYWLVVRLDGKEQFLGLPAGEGQALRESLRGLPQRHFPGVPRMQELLEDALRYAGESGAHAELRLRLRVIEFLLLIVEQAQAEEVPFRSPGIAAVVTRIRRDPRERLELADLAELAGMSLSHFKRQFRREIGLPPHEYILRCKLEGAGEQLRDPTRGVTEVAFDFGFSSSAYFSSVFRRFFGCSPSAWRAGRRD